VRTAPLLALIGLQFWAYKAAPAPEQAWAYYIATGWFIVGLCALLAESLHAWPWTWACSIGMLEGAQQGVCGLRGYLDPVVIVPGESICKTQLGFTMSVYSLIAIGILAAVLAAAIHRSAHRES
jgi:hypothetical protein